MKTSTLFGIAVVVVGIGFLIRNWLVFVYRGKMLNKLGKAADEDCLNLYEFHWRYDDFHRVGYEDQLLIFWKRFDSFYPDKTFLNPKVFRTIRKHEKLKQDIINLKEIQDKLRGKIAELNTAPSLQDKIENPFIN